VIAGRGDMRTPGYAASFICFLVGFGFLLLCIGPVAAGDMSRTSRYFKDAEGNPVFFMGYYGWAATAQGHYIDHPSRYADMINEGSPYKINYIRISLGINRFTGSTNPQSYDRRETPVPFRYINNKADLDQWDETFWAGLRYHCELARQKGIIVHVAFFDGVGLRGGSYAYRWAGSAWNINNQTRNFFGNLDVNGNGNADENGEFYRLTDFNNNAGVGYYQRRVIDKAIAETAAYDNVFYEVGNELLGAPSNWYFAVMNYIKARTNKPVTHSGGSRSSNTDGEADHGGNDPAAIKSRAASGVGNGYPWWNDPDGSALGNGSPDNLRRAAWYSFTGGAAGWGGFTYDFWTGYGGFNTTKATYYRNLMLFIEASGVRFWNMVPSHSLVSNSSVNSCIANPGLEYVAYILNNSSVTLNLSAVSGTAYYRLYDPRTAAWSSQQTVAGGGTRSFDRPAGAEDWVIHVYLAPDTQTPSIPTNVSASGLSDASILVSWTASTDNVGVAGYKVYRNENMVGTSPATNYLDTGLSASTTYSYRVSAYDASGNESAQSSPPAVATTAATIDYCSIDLGATNVVNLLTHPQNSDGDTTSAVVDGLECRRPINTGDQYFYFAIDDSFMFNEPGTTRYLEVCYFDDQSSSVYMQPQYDAVGDGIGNMYRSGSNVNLTNTGKWRTATWTLTDCRFSNRQNAGADFRIYVGPYNVKIDSVRVSRTPWNQYNTAERSLGTSEIYRGISHPQPSDGTTIPATIGGRECRRTSGTGSHFYFNVSDAIIYDGNPSTVYLMVDYYDSPGGMIQPQYDSTTGIYTNASTLNFTGTNTWKTAAWTLTNARFANRQNCSADFRLSVGAGSNVHISRVLVSKIPFVGDITPPSAPTNVSAVTKSPTFIQVMWTASTDNVGVTGYRIFRNGSEVETTSATTYTDTGLVPVTSYSYRVSAFDEAGNNSAQSSPAAVASTMPAVDITSVKQIADGVVVGLVSQVVTAVFDNYLYIGEVDRQTGIRIEPLAMPAGMSVGSIVDIGGTLQTVDGERRIKEAFISSSGD
jgi:chitodextrinase